MTLSLARDVASFGIRVVTVAPHLMETPSLAGLPEDVRDGLSASVPFPRRLGRPAEFAGFVEHTVSNPKRNGSVARLDGTVGSQPKWHWRRYFSAHDEQALAIRTLLC